VRTEIFRACYGSGGIRLSFFAQSGTFCTAIFEELSMSLIWIILVGLIAGWLAGTLVKGGSFGLVGDIIVGVLGALIGQFLARQLGVSVGGGLLGSIAVATIGAVVLLFLLRLIKRK
jgi:uncharacterized membrane protein YeaQ/YmgE (transglycosylase-associated protein family)